MTYEADPFLAEFDLSDEDLAEQDCRCEPCPMCQWNEPHEVGHECEEYSCLRCEARERLTDEPPVAFGGKP
jgi:hypothetical protein